MEISFLDLKEREIINVFDGKKLGRIIDVVFNSSSGQVIGIVAPGDKKIFRKIDDIFIPLEKIKRIGNDVILVGLQFENGYFRNRTKKMMNKNSRSYENYYGDLIFDTNTRINNFKKNLERHDIFYSSTAKGICNQKEIKKNVSFVRLKPLENKKYK